MTSCASFCFFLKIDYIELSGASTTAKGIGFAGSVERQDRAADLVRMAASIRPDLSWPGPGSETAEPTLNGLIEPLCASFSSKPLMEELRMLALTLTCRL